MGIKEIAEKRIDKLLKLALKNPEYSKRYIEIALKLQQKARVKLKPWQKQLFCKKCFCILKPEDKKQKKGYIEITCHSCNAKYRRKGKLESI